MLWMTKIGIRNCSSGINKHLLRLFWIIMIWLDDAFGYIHILVNRIDIIIVLHFITMPFGTMKLDNGLKILSTQPLFLASFFVPINNIFCFRWMFDVFGFIRKRSEKKMEAISRNISTHYIGICLNDASATA